MHPDVVLFADVRDGNERVKGSVHCCSCSRTNKERYKTLHRNKEVNIVNKPPIDEVITIPICFQISLIITVVSVD